MSLGCHGERIVRWWYVHIQKNVEPVSVTRFTCWGSGIALSVETSNAESPTMIYIAHIPEQLPITSSYRKCSGCNVYTPHRASPLLCFWQIFWIFQIPTRQNQSVQLRLLCICAHPCLSRNGTFGKCRLCKNREYFRKREKKDGKIDRILDFLSCLRANPCIT